jgi:uncharacterized protein YacL
MKTAPIKTELHFAYFRLFVGALIGFFVLSIFAASILYINGWFEPDVARNPYLGPPPLMTVIVFGFFGLVIGALLSLITKKWKRYKQLY